MKKSIRAICLSLIVAVAMAWIFIGLAQAQCGGSMDHNSMGPSGSMGQLQMGHGNMDSMSQGQPMGAGNMGPSQMGAGQMGPGGMGAAGMGPGNPQAGNNAGSGGSSSGHAGHVNPQQ